MAGTGIVPYEVRHVLPERFVKLAVLVGRRQCGHVTEGQFSGLSTTWLIDRIAKVLLAGVRHTLDARAELDAKLSQSDEFTAPSNVLVG
jgi:hypothetical protein